jgi:hypothetical protein
VAAGEYEFAIPHFFEEMANDDYSLSISNQQLPRVASAAGSRATREAPDTR